MNERAKTMESSAESVRRSMLHYYELLSGETYSAITKLFESRLRSKYDPEDFHIDLMPEVLTKKRFFGYIIDSRIGPAAAAESERLPIEKLWGISSIEIEKNLFLFEEFIRSIYNNNLDRSVLQAGRPVGDTRMAFNWLFLNPSLISQPNDQDVNRLLNMLMYGVFYVYQSDKDRVLNTEKIVKIFYEKKAEYNRKDSAGKRELISKLLGSQSKDDKRNEENHKNGGGAKSEDNLNGIIDTVFDIYKALATFRDYYMGNRFYEDVLWARAKNRGDEAVSEEIRKIVSLSNLIRISVLLLFSSYMKFSQLVLPHSDFSGSIFEHIDMTGGNFVNSSFAGSVMENAVLSGSDLAICDFTSAFCAGADFSNCNLNYVKLVGTVMRSVVLKNASMDSALFWQYPASKKRALSASAYSGADFRREFVDLIPKRDSEVYRTVFSGASGSGAHLCMAREETALDYSRTILDAAAEICRNACERLIAGLEEGMLSSEELRRMTEEAVGPADFTGATLDGATVQNADLSYVKMENASCVGADLSGCRIVNQGAGTGGAKNAVFEGAVMTSAAIYRTSLAGALFDKAALINSLFLNCDLDGASFSGTKLSDSLIINTEPIRAEGKSANVYLSAIIRPAQAGGRGRRYNKFLDMVVDTEFDAGFSSMNDVNMAGALASNIFIAGMNIDRSNFSDCNLKRACWLNCLARWGGFGGADLTYSLLIGVSFHQSAFNSAQFSKAHVFGCEFSGCRLSNALLIGALFERCIFFDNDLSGANFSHTVIRGCQFNDVNLSGVNFSNTCFENVVFRNTNFSNCFGLNSAKFLDCIIDPDSCSGISFLSGKQYVRLDASGVILSRFCKGLYDVYGNAC